ncbi:MAG: hypothetical protein ABIJ03_00265 [Patescibacteria group bacterium]|nr:hypothetical protein [Patescibacteria group bacterium]
MLKLRKNLFIILSTCSLGILLFINILSLFINIKQSFIFNQIGSINWILSYFLIIVFSIKSLIKLIKLSFNKKWFLTLLIIIIFVFLSFFQAIQTASVSHETTQEVACITNSKYLGEKYNQPCFLGYPARQYLIQALPSLFFTKSIVTLNSGAILYFIPGLIIFSYALIYANKNKKYPDEIVSIALSLLLSFYFISHFYFHSFEQSIFPLSLGLAGTGLSLLYKKSGKLDILLLLIIVIQHAIFAYTPALSLVPLFAVFFLIASYQWIKNKRNFVLIIMLFSVITGSSLAISMQNRSDIRVFNNHINSTSSIQDIIKETSAVLKHFFIQHTGGVEFASPIILWVLFTVVFFGSKKNRFNLILIVWALATMLIATTSQGYSKYGLDFRAHRSLVILPILLLGFSTSLIELLQKIKHQRISQIALFLILLATTTLGIHSTNEYLRANKTDDRTLLSLWMQKNTDASQTYDLFIIEPQPYQDLLSLNDKLQYFASSIKSQILAENESCPLEKGIYFINPISPCINSYQNSLRYQPEQYVDTKGYKYEIIIKKN